MYYNMCLPIFRKRNPFSSSAPILIAFSYVPRYLIIHIINLGLLLITVCDFPH